MSGEASYLDIAMNLGADDTIPKPFNVQELVTRIASQLDYQGVRQAVR
jgi:DNA-binding response OmpR family regulator